MKLCITAILYVLIALSTSSFAAEVREIELNDGSVVTGEVVSLSNGVYTVRTGSLGTITIEESRVRSIRQKGAAAPSSDVSAEARSLQERMVKDQEIMSMIESLRTDPEFQKILQDPEVMKAVNAGDIAALTANPAFMKLLQNSTVQNIKNKVGE